MTARYLRNKRNKSERQAIERAMVRTMRKLWIRDEHTTLPPQTQVVLLGLELARRQVGK